MFWVDLIITHHLKPVQKLYFHLIFIVILVKKFLSVSSARAGNVMGGRYEKNRIIPDIIKS